MTAMTFTSQADGVWADNTSTVWAKTAGSGHNFPIAGDTVYINGGYTITIANGTPAACLKLYLGDAQDGAGYLYMYDNLTFDDASGAGIEVDDTFAVTITANNGTTQYTPEMNSASATPSNPWLFTIHPSDAAVNLQNLLLDYIHMTGNAWTLSTTDSILYFNNGTAYPTMETHGPVERLPRIVAVPCDGRSTDRIYRLGSGAGFVTCTGTIAWSSRNYATLKDMCSENSRAILITDYVHLPSAAITRCSFKTTAGSLYVNYNLTLTEDK